jgi:hypothetical protein
MRPLHRMRAVLTAAASTAVVTLAMGSVATKTASNARIWSYTPAS